MVIEPRVVQFWSEIILVISNHAYDFSPDCTPLSSITITNVPSVKIKEEDTINSRPLKNGKLRKEFTALILKIYLP